MTAVTEHESGPKPSITGMSPTQAQNGIAYSSTTPSDPFILPASELRPCLRLLRQVRTGERVPVTLRMATKRTSVHLALAAIPLSTKYEEFYGIEYDDASRGKHEGVQGDLQFTPRQKGKGACSFLLTPKDLRRGYTFAEALAERYDVDIPGVVRVSRGASAQGDKGGVEKGILLGSSGGTIVVEAPGMMEVQKRLSALGRLQTVGLEAYDVYKLGGDENTKRFLQANLTSLTTLNLSNNLIYYWSDLAEIVSCIPSLRKLILNNSRIEVRSRHQNDIKADDAIRQAFKVIREVELCNCLMSWVDVMSIVPFFPRVERLDLVDNAELVGMDSMRTENGVPVLLELRYLNLAGCGISDWANTMSAVQALPQLETLDLSNTPLSCMSSPPNSASVRLPILILHNSAIASWASIDALQQWTGGTLSSLRFTVGKEVSADSPVLPDTAGPAEPLIISGDQARDRQLLIAKLSGLISLNSTLVTAPERRDAEMAYVRSVDRLHSEGKAKMEDWGRYADLRALHGLDAGLQTSGGASKPGPLKSNMIDLSIHRSPDDGSSPEQISILPATPISLLRKKIAKALGLPAAALSPLRIWTAKSVASSEEREWSSPVKAVEVEDGDTAGWWFSKGDAVIVEI